ATPPSSAAGASTATPGPAPTSSWSGRSSSTWPTSWPAERPADCGPRTGETLGIGDEQSGGTDMDETGAQEPVERETARLADLPVEGLPQDAPDVPSAATHAAPPELDPGGTAPHPARE